MSGPFADLTGSGSVEAARLAIGSEAPRIGRPIECFVGDPQNKPDVGLQIARQWFDVDRVDVIVDVPNSGVALAVQSLARDQRKLVLYSGGAASDLSGRACMPYGLQWTFDTYGLARGATTALVQEGLKSWFSAYR